MKRLSALVLTLSFAMLLCACDVWPKEPEKIIPWPAELLPEGLPVPDSEVLNVGEIDGSTYIELKTNLARMKTYFGELEKQGYIISSYSPPSGASKDDVRIELEWHGGSQAGMTIWTGQEPPGYPIAAAYLDGRFAIMLEENPTTGYAWHCVIEDESVVRLVSDEYASDEAPEGYTGVGGIRSFFFEGVRPGYTKVVFTEMRGTGDVSGTVAYKVTVNNDGVIAKGIRVPVDY